VIFATVNVQSSAVTVDGTSKVVTIVTKFSPAPVARSSVLVRFASTAIVAKLTGTPVASFIWKFRYAPIIVAQAQASLSTAAARRSADHMNLRAADDIILTSGDVTVTIPLAAVKPGTSVAGFTFIAPTATADKTNIATQQVSVVSNIVSLSPTGTTFNSAITLSIPYTCDTAVPTGRTRTISKEVTAASGNLWVQVTGEVSKVETGSVATNNRKCFYVTPLTSFSQYAIVDVSAVAVATPPSGPSPPGFSPGASPPAAGPSAPVFFSTASSISTSFIMIIASLAALLCSVLVL